MDSHTRLPALLVTNDAAAAAVDNDGNDIANNIGGVQAHTSSRGGGHGTGGASHNNEVVHPAHERVSVAGAALVLSTATSRRSTANLTAPGNAPPTLRPSIHQAAPATSLSTSTATSRRSSFGRSNRNLSHVSYYDEEMVTRNVVQGRRQGHEKDDGDEEEENEEEEEEEEEERHFGSGFGFTGGRPGALRARSSLKLSRRSLGRDASLRRPPLQEEEGSEQVQQASRGHGGSGGNSGEARHHPAVQRAISVSGRGTGGEYRFPSALEGGESDDEGMWGWKRAAAPAPSGVSRTRRPMGLSTGSLVGERRQHQHGLLTAPAGENPRAGRRSSLANGSSHIVGRPKSERSIGTGTGTNLSRRNSTMSGGSTRLQRMTDFVVDWVTAAAAVYFLAFGTTMAILFLLFGTELPNIALYNLTHLVVAMLGKILISSGVILGALCSKAAVASGMVFSARGVSLVEAVVKPGWHAPAAGRTMRHLFYASLVAVEASLWLLEYEMEWEPIDMSVLGTFDCIPVTYSKENYPDHHIQAYFEGNQEYAHIYSYGIPLVDGVVGGFSAWPLDGPASAFSVEGPGVVYLASTQCGTPTPVGVAQAATTVRPPATTLRLHRAEMWEDVGIIHIAMTLPAHWHDAGDYLDYDVEQECSVELMSGPATVKYSFVLDEWDLISGGQMMEAQFGDPYKAERAAGLTAGLPVFDTDVLTVDHGVGTDLLDGMYTGQVRERLLPVASEYTNITKWIIWQLNQTLYADMASTGTTGNGSDGEVEVSCEARRSSGLCGILAWMVGSNLKYETGRATRAVSALVGEVGHYVTNQYDGNIKAKCTYYGDTGYGVVALPAWVEAVVETALGIAGFLALWQVSAFWLVGGGASVLSAAASAVLDDPVVMLYYARRGVGRMVPGRMGEGKLPGGGRRGLVEFLAGVSVRFGELKALRGEREGALALDITGEVVRMREHQFEDQDQD
ncbi:hypothetical protein HK405_008037 [Cladochytrium tenue]|nr:hypothetical protein HK405_008037 [Cladochytrium tenue]